MANVLPFAKQVLAVNMLAEGSSIRSIERVTGVHRDTVMRLGVRVGMACHTLLDESMRDLDCRQIQIDEVWGFIGKKARVATEDDQYIGLGDVWTYVALDPESKLVPSFVVGKRDYEHTQKFTSDLASRMRHRNQVQISSDGMNQYLATIEDAFGADANYGQIVKIYGNDPEGNANSRRYSPPPVTAVRKTVISGNPDEEFISTSLVERQNLTMRMHVRRLTRLTNAFSKKLDNFKAAVALHFAYYNFVKIHKTIRCTPAMAIGITSRLWKVEELVERAV
jgi:IS1 family transposase